MTKDFFIVELSAVNILGLDYGEKRIGLAFADELGVAYPLPAAIQPTFEERLAHIEKFIKERKVQMILVGYPYNMDSTIGFKAKEVDAFIEKLKKFNLPIETSDERLSTFQAENDMMSFGTSKKKSVAKHKRYRKSGDIDSRSIALVLQDYIDNAKI